MVRVMDLSRTREMIEKGMSTLFVEVDGDRTHFVETFSRLFFGSFQGLRTSVFEILVLRVIIGTGKFNGFGSGKQFLTGKAKACIMD